MIQIATAAGSHNIYAPVFAAFAQLATKEKQIDDSSLERVAQLLETLRAKVQEAYNAFAEEDASAVQSFNDQKERLENNLSRLEAQAARLERSWWAQPMYRNPIRHCPNRQQQAPKKPTTLGPS